MMKMIELITNKPTVTYNLDNTCNICFVIGKNNLTAIDNIRTDKLLLTIKEYRPKRSLTQNAYMWALLNQLAEKLGNTAENIYKHYVKDYGVRDYLLIQDQAVDELKNRWEKKGMGWFVEVMRKGKVEGTTTIVVYWGSSSYDSKQMSRLVDAVISDCEENGIHTMTKNEIMSLHNEND